MIFFKIYPDGSVCRITYAGPMSHEIRERILEQLEKIAKKDWQDKRRQQKRR